MKKSSPAPPPPGRQIGLAALGREMQCRDKPAGRVTPSRRPRAAHDDASQPLVALSLGAGGLITRSWTCTQASQVYVAPRVGGGCLTVQLASLFLPALTALSL